MRQIYSAVFFLLLPLVLLRLFLRSLAAPAYRKRWTERFGRVTARPGEGGVIWVHTVSVGEFIAAEPLIRRLKREYNRPVLVTCMTPTGSDRIVDAFGDSVYHQYLPYDLGLFLKPLFKAFRPALLLIMETELWPNLVATANREGVPVVLANGRLSDRSARGYKRLPGLASSMLKQIGFFAVQSGQDRDNFVSLGVAEDRVAVTGSIKFDVTINENMVEKGGELRSRMGTGRKSWVAASTHEGEDEIVLEVHSRLRQAWPDLLLVIVPRHPERFNSVARLIDQKGFKYYRRSTGSAGRDCDVFLGDTMGEMMLFYAMADIVFVGGSLVDNGGHNILEPAVLGLPIITGDHMYNFQWVVDEFLEHDAVRMVSNGEELEAELRQLLRDDEGRETLSWAAMNVIETNRGAIDRLVDHLRNQLAPETDESKAREDNECR